MRIITETELQARIDAAYEEAGRPAMWVYNRADFLDDDEFTEEEN